PKRRTPRGAWAARGGLMLHAAAMVAGLWGLWLIMTQSWANPVQAALGAGAALLCVIAAARLGGLGRGASALLRAPQLALLGLGRTGAVFAGAFGVAGAALTGGRGSLRPALVRVRQRPASDVNRATLAGLIGAAPGALVVEADADGLLAHV